MIASFFTSCLSFLARSFSLLVVLSTFFLVPFSLHAIDESDIKIDPSHMPAGSIALPTQGESDAMSIAVILGAVQEILLKLVLPIVIVGAAIYIAYTLFVAEGDPEKGKRAMTAITYTIIALIAISLAYVVIALIPTLKF